METRNLTFPVTVKWRSRNFKPYKPFPYQVRFENEEDRNTLYNFTAIEFIHDKIYHAERVEAVEINGEILWTRQDGFKFILNEFDDVLYDTNRRKYSSKRQTFIDFFKN